MRSLNWFSLTPLLLTLSLFGCQGEAPTPPPAKAPTAAPEKKAEAKLVAKKEAKVAKPFTYNPVGKPDPFKPFLRAKALPPRTAAPPLTAPPRVVVRRPERPVYPGAPGTPGVPKPPPVPPSPLQSFGLDQLKLVGIIWQIDEGRALIEDPTGKGYIVSEGAAIGLRDGKIAKISREGVFVAEESVNQEGKVTRKEMIMRLGGGIGGR